jgi:hypothetical protein
MTDHSEIYTRILYSNINIQLKLKALEDIITMENNYEYRNKVDFCRECPSLFDAFIWDKTILGTVFWQDIDILLT